MRRSDRRLVIFASIAVILFFIILFLTFQNAEHTRALSLGIKLWLQEVGISVSEETLRSNAHFAEYLILGLVLALFGKTAKLRNVWILLIGCSLGLLDEGIRILLPTREFELIDLIKDWIGIVVAFGIVEMAGYFNKQKAQYKSDKHIK